MQYVTKRASYESRFDILPNNDEDILRTDAVENYIQNRMKGRVMRGSGSRSGPRRMKPRGPKRGRWVCNEKDHYANERHTPQEVAEARKIGRTVLTYVVILSSKRATRVLTAYTQQVKKQASSSESSESENDPSDVDEDVADVSGAILSFFEHRSVNTDDFNKATACAAMETAFVLSISSTWDEDMQEEMQRMTRHLSADEQSFDGIVLNTACTGASVVSAAKYERYCRDTGAEYHIELNSSGYVNFGDAKKGKKRGMIKSLGTARIRGYVDKFDEVFEFQAHVVPGTDTPFLMSIQDLDGFGYDMRTGTPSLWAKDRKASTLDEFTRRPHRLHIDSAGHGTIRW